MILKTLFLLSLLLRIGQATVYYGPLGNAVAVNSPSTYEELEVESFVQFKLHIIRKYEKTREELEVVEPIDNSKSISVMIDDGPTHDLQQGQGVNLMLPGTTQPRVQYERFKLRIRGVGVIVLSPPRGVRPGQFLPYQLPRFIRPRDDQV